MEGHPKFRVDLLVYGRDEHEAKDRLVLKDPLSDKFFRLSAYEFTLLQSLDGTVTLEQAVEKLKRLGHYYSVADARFILGNAAQLGLIMGTKFSTAQFQQYLKKRLQKAQRTKFLSSVYFLFIPILNPDEFLQRTLWMFKLLANKWTGLVAAVAAAGAGYLMIAGLPRMQLEYLFFFNWENLLFLWITLGFTKLVHEFAHAYVAKGFGLRVPEMGVAFLIFFPCLYCNTTDAWQLADRKQRAAISAAGIIAEAVLAVISTYIWYFSQPGLVNSLAFYLMAISFVSTVLFNGNPLLKFDGYFLLIDFLDMPNLAANSLKYVKYLFLNRVMGNDLVTNPARTRRDTAIFTVYGISAFLYRISLYLGITVTVYYRFDKLLGILLAVLALGLFIVRPVWMGLKSMYVNRGRFRPRLPGSGALIAILAAMLVALLVPWSTRSVYPCFVGSQRIQKLTVPLHTFVSEVLIREGSLVRQGETLFRLDVTQLSLRLGQKEIQRNILEKEMQLFALDDKLRSKIEGKEVELKQTDDEIRQLQEQVRLARKSIIAPFDGVVTNLDARMQHGFQPGEGMVVGEVQSIRDPAIHALIPAADIRHLHKDLPVEIWLPLGIGKFLTATIDSIKPYSETDLRNSPFSSRLGGELATETRSEHRRDAPLEAQFDCSVLVTDTDKDIPLGMTGRMAVSLHPGSIASRIFEQLLRTFNRESLF
jgi:putative peptide zinc metalloprotease protein